MLLVPSTAVAGAIATLLAAPGAAATPTAADRVVDCHVWAPYPNLLVSSASALAGVGVMLNRGRASRSLERLAIQAV